MADDEQATPRRRRRARTDGGRPDEAPQADEQPGEPDEEGAPDEEDARGDAQEGSDVGADNGERDGMAIPAAAAARRAAQHVADFTGRHPESVVSIEHRDGGWQVGIEVVETRRIPDTTDVLAIYDVRLDGGGRLLSYRRTRRYARGQLDKECR